MNRPFVWKIWGDAAARLERYRFFSWVDLVVLAGLGAVLYGVIDLGRQWAGNLQPTPAIDISPSALPLYTFFSLSRGLLAYVLSLTFTLVYGYWAAKDRVAERVLIPLLDILQSIPVLGFLPGVVLALKGAFPYGNVGLELAAIVMIFTGQAWNMTFSFYHSVRSVPLDQREVATIFRFNWWQRFRWVELPYSTIGLVWNSMMSMAGGWFFLMINESFQLGGQDFKLPGVGSYMSVAVNEGRVGAMLWAIFAMVTMIVLLDQLLWRPVVVWAQKFRVEEGGYQEEMKSWFLEWLRRSRIVAAVLAWLRRFRQERSAAPKPPAPPDAAAPVAWADRLSLVLFLGLLVVLSYGAWKLLLFLHVVSFDNWRGMVGSGFITLARVLASTAIGTLWALPAGLAIGLSPRLSRALQPVVQVVASFPAPMLFPLVIAGLGWAHVSLGWGSILLMLLGTQWYILFNVIAGAMAVPADLKEAARSYHLGRWQRFWVMYAPAVFPYLVTGWVTAAGGAWNASIVAEYVTFKGQVFQANGLGARICAAAEEANAAALAGDAAARDIHYALLAAGVLVMSILVVIFNRTVWRRCYALGEKRFSLNR